MGCGDGGEHGDAGDWGTDFEMRILGGGYESDAGRPGYSSLAVDLEHWHLRLLLLQIWWKCFGTRGQRDRWPDLD